MVALRLGRHEDLPLPKDRKLGTLLRRPVLGYGELEKFEILTRL